MRKTIVALMMLAAVPVAAQVPGEKTSGGMVFRIGLAEAMAAARMSGHKPVPSGASDHLVVSLADARTGERITDAKVRVDVAHPGSDPAEAMLVRMPPRGAESYGAYLDLRLRGRYRFRITADRPGRAAPAIAEFIYDRF